MELDFLKKEVEREKLELEQEEERRSLEKQLEGIRRRKAEIGMIKSPEQKKGGIKVSLDFDKYRETSSIW